MIEFIFFDIDPDVVHEYHEILKDLNGVKGVKVVLKGVDEMAKLVDMFVSPANSFGYIKYDINRSKKKPMIVKLRY